ncbi:MAG: Sec-independent protein translocase protein TatA [Pseudomonadota bacterium]|nr:MAG: Sec-independent protein translocase protein TatA [Pseudomonadota bacterium]
MFGIGLPEMIIIAVVALIFIGPDKLPGVLRSIGKGLVELKRATSDVRSNVQEEMQKIEEEIELKEVRESAQDFKNELGGVANKIDPLTLSKFNSGDQKEVISDSIDESEKIRLKQNRLLKIPKLKPPMVLMKLMKKTIFKKRRII